MSTQVTGQVTGDPLGESQILVAIQRAISTTPELRVGTLAVARGMSHFGEHALGWMGLAAAGYVLDKQRSTQWLHVGASAFTAHAASVVLKRIVRRPRPHHKNIAIGVGTPSKLSFPSSHATSSTAALVALAQLLGNPAPLIGVPAMALSRLVLGVHYPTDVAIGSALGASTALALRPVVNRVA
ncbi:phosphatase PAP2 family protein [Corynebacterium sp. 320]|uniref:phosphatase PAP2 family protein n=1 Tax=Corynebacterium TaxID=1716 RepID=UPI00125CC7F1|nr:MULTISPECIES: phosphatase PAP2 family protein [Corynebacterium]KAB1504341.1 phosphatase PAP2 family protein [Corynebacterium sp. 320]KAB1552559.1 phosphatase PAP2 family protein [Corynebacterium sp. 321]KAB3528477.1 phosphatase PAP2 family protein [Corynebacterium sp. 250]QNP92017.1 phosphatase PAP2 family protein [Corynebacterium zhongnanshanii]